MGISGHRPTILLYMHSISPARGCILSSEHVERRLAAILAADVAGSCRLIGIDEEGTLAQLKALRKTLFDPKITEHHGRIVKNTGDGALVEFASVVDDAEPLALPDRPSIAVLPFQNMSGDPEQEYFADGIVDDITTALSRFKSLFVIARNSSFTYKGKSVDIKQVGRELGVRYVLEGSVRKSGNRVRITGQLIEAASDAHLWADRFEGSLEDVFDLQDQVASAVVGGIDPRIVEAEIARIKRKPPDNLDAYDCFLRGSDLCSRWRADANEAALRLFYRAIELDPEYAPAYAYACWCHLFRVQLGIDFTPEQRRETARLAHEAARLG